MTILALDSLELGWLIAIFVAGAAMVWWAGFRISIYANSIAERTGIGKAFIGALLLGAITSLPEVATTLTSSFNNNVSLAVNNIIGGVALQVAILAIADYFLKGRGITTAITKPIILLQGLLFILVLCITIVGALVKDVAFLGIGRWVWIITFSSVFAFYLIHKYQGSEIFLEVRNSKKKEILENIKTEAENAQLESFSFSNAKLYSLTALLGMAVLVGGFFCANTADLIAEKTGLGSSFMGIFFLALATSLPELSTSISAVRIKQYELAFSDIFGTNIFDILLLFVADIVYTDGLIMNQIQAFSIIGAAMAAMITTIYMMGMLVKPRKQLMNLGIDSIAVLLVYFSGLFLLYSLRGG